MRSSLKRPPVFWLLSGLVLVASLEIFFHVSWTPPKPQYEFFTEYDPVYGWRKIPDVHRLYHGDEYSTLETFNSKGIRGPEYPYKKQNNEYRILILGDSQSEGYSVEFQDLFSEVLKRKLNAREDRPYQVINTGTRAYSTDQEMLFFQKEAKNYRPDLTVLMFSTNNVWGNQVADAEGRPKPFFEFQGHDLKLRNVPVPQPKPLSGVQGILKTQCFLCQWIRTQLKPTSFLQWMTAFKLALMPDYLRVWKKKDDSTSLHAWRITEALLVKLKEETRKSGSRFFVCYAPGSDQIDEEVWLHTRQKYGLVGGGEWDPLKVGRELERLCAKNHIDFLTLTPTFQSGAKHLRQGAKALYFLSDGHWTAKGHELAGNTLKEYITQEHLALKNNIERLS